MLFRKLTNSRSLLLCAIVSLVITGCKKTSIRGPLKAAATPEVIECDTSAAPFGGGDGSVGSPYTICTRAHLEEIDDFAYNLLNFKITADLDLGGIATPWTSLGSTNIVLDGNNHTISNLYSTGGGFIHEFYGTIKNLTLDAADVSSPVIAAGILTNSMIGATIENVTISNSSLDVDGNRAGVVSAITTGGTITNVTVSNVSIDCIENCGGLVGRSATAPLTITDSSVTGTLTAGGFAVGGFIGFSQLVTMSDSYTDVAINNAAGASGTGGIVGWHSAGCSATRMMALGDVTADGGYTGGAFGANYADVYEVVATGDVTATGSSTGGLIGIAAQGNIHDSLASGNVSGNNFGVGGLIGRLGSVVVADVQRNFSLSPTVTALDLDVGGAIGMVTDAPVIQDNFYWDNGVADVNATALVTGQLPTSANFINFIFPTTWKMTTAAPFGAPAIAPVPAWICTAAYSGVTCP